MAEITVDSDGVLRRIVLDGETSLTLPSEVREIAPFVFTEDVELTSLTLDANCETIRNKAFFFNRTIATISIPSGSKLKTIETYAIAGYNPVSVFSGSSTDYSSSSDGLLYDASGTKVVLGVNKEEVELETGTTEICARAFSFCDKIASIALPDTLTAIGSYAFSDCSGLKTIRIPSGVEYVGYGAFFGCSSIENVALTSGVKVLDGLSFAAMPSLSVVMLPSSVETIGRVIGEEAFAGCRQSLYFGLTDSTSEYGHIIPQLPPTANYGEMGGTVKVVFHLGGNEDDLGNVEVGSSFGPLITAAEESLGNQYVTIQGWYYDDETFAKPCTAADVVTNYRIVDGSIEKIERIDVYAKYTAQEFTITLDLCYDGRTATIEPLPYGSAINIKDYLIPYRTMYSFDGWYGGKSGDVYSDPLTDAEGNTYITVDGDRTIYAKWNSQSDVYETSIVGDESKHEVSIVSVLDWSRVYSAGNVIEIPGAIALDGVDYTVVSIGSNVFRGAEELKAVTIPESVKSIGSRCFSGCIELASVTFLGKSRCTTIGARAFEETAITEFTVPVSVTSIRQGAFFNCQSLETITFNSKIANIGTEAGNNRGTFEDCDNLTIVRIPTVADWLKISFGNSACNPLSNGTGLMVEDPGAEGGYSAVTKLDSTNLGIITEIRNFAFTGCSSMERLDLAGTSVTRVGDEAFSANENLSSVVLSNGNIDTIGRAAFSNNSGITAVTVPGTIRTLGGFVFNGCSSMARATIEDGCLVVSQSMFSACANLQDITIPDSVMEIGASAFSGDTELWAVGFKTKAGSRCSMIGAYAFYGCTGLGRICCLDGVVLDGETESEDLPSPSFPDSILRIGEHAFDRCTVLETNNLYGYAELGEWILRRL